MTRKRPFKKACAAIALLGMMQHVAPPPRRPLKP